MRVSDTLLHVSCSFFVCTHLSIQTYRGDNKVRGRAPTAGDEKKPSPSHINLQLGTRSSGIHQLHMLIGFDINIILESTMVVCSHNEV